MYSLYKLSFPNGKLYLGITGNMTRRLNDHKTAASSGSSLPVHRAIRRFGWGRVSSSVLALGDRGYIAALEVRAIKSFGTLCNDGYNVSTGGDISPMLIDSVRKKQAATLRGYKHTDEARANMSACRIGRKHTDAAKEKIRAANKGKIVTEATREKLRSRKPPKVSAETRYKMSVAHLRMYQDPEFKARHTEGVRRAAERQRNR